MSTRATYNLPTAFAGNITIYKHHDGYLSGGAAWLSGAASLKEGGGSLAEAFLRANVNSEITESHESHSDTQFRYTVTREDGGGYKLVVDTVDWSSNTWRPVFDGSLVEFIAEHEIPEMERTL